MDTYTDIATYRLKLPRGQFSEEKKKTVSPALDPSLFISEMNSDEFKKKSECCRGIQIIMTADECRYIQMNADEFKRMQINVDE